MKAKKTKKKILAKPKARKKKSSAKTKVGKKPQVSKAASLKRSTKKMVDDVLLKMNPQVQKQFENLKASIESTPTSVADLKILGLKVLERARIFSESLRANSTSSASKPPVAAKAVRSKK